MKALRRSALVTSSLSALLVLSLGGCPKTAPEVLPDGDNSNSGSATGADNGGGSADLGGGSDGAENSNSLGNSNSAGNSNSSGGADGSGGTDTSGNTNGDTGTDGTTDGNSDTPPEISNTADSIKTAAAGTRNDPEGVAAPAAVTSITWKDARHADRTMILGGYLYQYDFSFDDNNQIVTRSANDDAYGHEGFGYVVSHNNQTGNSPIGKGNTPSSVTTTVLTGGHHAIHRVELVYDRDREGGGYGIKIPVVIEWLAATGRDHPVWAVTWKTAEATNPQNISFDTYRMDVRGPYGSLNFDGAATRDQGDAIGGVAWGDFGLKFATTDGQLTLNSPWTYNAANNVCFTQTWTANVNAEMGIVQTRPADKEMGYPDRVYGRERGSTSAANFLNKGDCAGLGDNRNYIMPCVNGWPYQLMNFDWDAGAGKPVNEATGTKLIAWGTPYGWLGSSNCDVFDYSGTIDARGDRSFATLIVLGPKARFNAQNNMYDQDGDVALAIKEVDALASAIISDVTVGSVATQVPSGPGAAQTKNIANGYNDTYTAYYLPADANKVAFKFVPAAGKPVKAPIFVIQNYTTKRLPKITLAGKTLATNTGEAGSEAFVSLNTATNELWVTLNSTISAAADVQITDEGAKSAMTPDQKRRADQFVSVFENDTIVLQYAFVAALDDGRGYTAGRAGFTSATGDLLEVIESYVAAVPGNPLAAYLPRLRELATAKSPAISGLDGFPEAWAAAAADAKFRAAQDAVTDQEYYQPAIELWRRTGLTTPLSLAELYDALIQHGGGEDQDGVPAMVDRATARVGGNPGRGAIEAAWLSAFLDVRRATLEFASNPATRAGWADSVDRVDAMREILTIGNFNLDGPIVIDTPDHHATIL